MTDLDYEVFMLWPAFESIADWHMPVDPLIADPREVYDAVFLVPRDRLVALLYGHGIGESMGESEAVLDELLPMLARGIRPRDGRSLRLERSAS